ncbi:DUF3515 domain-containing protein [Streptomyces sp. NPDC051133]|uniref:DUF3515 domain-containing protein n=1 Tax=Streptomyces sp. NPDC051133 TaxID=3155521 RepID=UPI0034474F9E
MTNRTRRTWIPLAGALAVCALGVAFAVVPSAERPRPAPFAHDPACARVAGQLPHKMGKLGLHLPVTDGIAVWGDNSVVVRCGIPMPDKTSDPCVTVDGVDWVWRYRQNKEGRSLLVTYGRSPALELSLDRAAPSDTALTTLTRAASELPRQRKCLDSQGR